MLLRTEGSNAGAREVARIAQSETCARPSTSSRSELVEIENAERFFEIPDLGDGLLEAVLTERLMLLLLELLAQASVFLLTDELVKGWKEDGVFARLVRTVHPDELPERSRESGAVSGVGGGRWNGMVEDVPGEGPAGSVLLAKGGDQIGELASFLEARKELRLFQLLVVALDEAADERCGRRAGARSRRRPGAGD